MKRLFALMCVVLLLLCFAASAEDMGYTIKNFDVQAEVRSDNSVFVKETITCDFYEASHGIIRTIPLTMDVGRAIIGETGSIHYKTKVTDISVAGAEHSVSTENSTCSIRIGSADRLVSGEVTYVISYLYTMPWDKLEETDFLFFSVLGSQWDVKIGHFSFDMTFPQPVDPSAICLYSGRTGGETNALKVLYRVSENGISGSAANIGANQAITVFSVLPQGYFEEKKPSTVIPYLFSGISFAVCGLTLLLSIFSPRRRPSVGLEKEPPEGVSPAEVGTIVDGMADDRDLLSMIPYWAEKGLISVEEKKTGYLLIRKKQELPKEAPEYQKKLYSALFSASDTCDTQLVGVKFAHAFDMAKNKLSAVFRGEKALYERSKLATRLCLLCILSAVLVLTVSEMDDIGGNLLLSLFACIPLMITAVAGHLGRQGNRWFKKTSGRIGCLISRGVVALLQLAACAVVVAGYEGDSVIPAGILAAVLVLAWAACYLSHRICIPSRYNVEVCSHLLSLKKFITTVDPCQLREMLDSDPLYYYRVLPYSMAMGMAEEWSRYFADQLLPVPDWYTPCSDDVTYFDTMMFERAVNKRFGGRITSSRPSSSSSGGSSSSHHASSSGSGGFSGGGGGGGGGSRW